MFIDFTFILRYFTFLLRYFIFLLRYLIFVILRYTLHISYMNIALLAFFDVLISLILMIKKKISADVSFFYTSIILMIHAIVQETRLYFFKQFITYVNVPIINFAAFCNLLWIIIITILCKKDRIYVVTKSVIESIMFVVILQYSDNHFT